LAMATATLANHGLRLQPQLVERMADTAGGLEHVNAPRIVGQIELTTRSHWDVAVKAMHGVVHGKKGTARKLAKGIDYTIAGKTGTAQVFGIPQDAEYDAEKIEKKLRDHALFIAFAPSKNPTIALAVVVENGGSGSATAAPIAKRLIEHFLRGRAQAPTVKPKLVALN
jgi:penicillin-binding protein 2